MRELLDIAHEMACDLFKVGAMNEITMRKMDALCLPPKRPFRPEDIRRILRFVDAMTENLEMRLTRALRECDRQAPCHLKQDWTSSAIGGNAKERRKGV